MSQFDSKCTKTTVQTVESGDTFYGVAKENADALKDCAEIPENQRLTQPELGALLKEINPDIQDISKIRVGQELKIPDPNSKNCSELQLPNHEDITVEACEGKVEGQVNYFVTENDKSLVLKPTELNDALQLRTKKEVTFQTIDGESLSGDISLARVMGKEGKLETVGELSFGNYQMRLPVSEMRQVVKLMGYQDSIDPNTQEVITEAPEVRLGSIRYIREIPGQTKGVKTASQLALIFQRKLEDGRAVDIAVSPEFLLKTRELIDNGIMKPTLDWGRNEKVSGEYVAERIVMLEFENPLKEGQTITLAPQAAVRFREAFLAIKNSGIDTKQITFEDSYRGYEEQCSAKSHTAQKAGQSAHNSGQAIDFSLPENISKEDYSKIDDTLNNHGWVVDRGYEWDVKKGRGNSGHRFYQFYNDSKSLGYETFSNTVGSGALARSLVQRDANPLLIPDDPANRCVEKLFEKMEEELQN